MALIKHTGSCHCGAIKYEAFAPNELNVYQCNCSICTKKQIPHFIIPATNFKLISGHAQLSTYTFGTHQAKHLFCAQCGVQSFFIPRFSSEAIAIVVNCVDDPNSLKFTTEIFHGENWEEAMEKLDISLDSANSHSHL